MSVPRRALVLHDNSNSANVAPWTMTAAAQRSVRTVFREADSRLFKSLHDEDNLLDLASWHKASRRLLAHAVEGKQKERWSENLILQPNLSETAQQKQMSGHWQDSALGVYSWTTSSCKLRHAPDGRRAPLSQVKVLPMDYAAYLCMHPNITSQDKQVCSQSSNLMHLFWYSVPSHSLVMQRENMSQYWCGPSRNCHLYQNEVL